MPPLRDMEVILDSHLAIGIYYKDKLQSWCSFGIYKNGLLIQQIQGMQTTHSAKPENKLGFIFNYQKFYMSLVYKLAHDFGYTEIYVVPAIANKWLDSNRNVNDGHSQRYDSLVKQYDNPAQELGMKLNEESDYFYISI